MRILGLTSAHDSSLCIINNGFIEYFSKEERLTRKKRDKTAKISFQNITGSFDYVILCSPTFSDYDKELQLLIKKKFNCPVINFHKQHHLSHASLAHYNSGFEKSLTVVIDRNGGVYNGMRESETVFEVSQNNFKELYKSFWLFNIGECYDRSNLEQIDILKKQNPNCTYVADSTMNITKVYETATSLIGEHPLENGKTMGLSSYGQDKNFINLFENGIPKTHLFWHKQDEDRKVLLKEHLYNQISEVNKNDYQFYADYSFQVQKQTQEEVLRLVKSYVNKTEIKNVCITGGYGLNVVCNTYLVKNLPNVNFYFEPLADDSGNSIGAAIFLWKQLTNNTDISKLTHTFFNNKIDNTPINGVSTTTKEIAMMLSKKKIIAVYNGCAEAGPRALGNRSILYDARDNNAKNIVNKVKNREWYRPFAASVLKEYAHNYFDMMNLKDSPFMTNSFNVISNNIPGVTHTDNTCRVQTVDKTIPHFYDLLTEFYLLTGIPLLLNTSFNVAGEPLVETIDDAIKTFNNSKIDVLWFPERKLVLYK
jgi:carbamoyltransferase